MNATDTITTALPVYYCKCKGCGNFPAGNRLFRAYWQGLIGELEGSYFSDNNRRFHRSKITKWRYHYINPGDEVYGVAIKESRAAGWEISNGREFAVSLWCRYGVLVDSYRQESGRAADKFMDSPAALELIKGCICHGCTIDRAGRKPKN